MKKALSVILAVVLSLTVFSLPFTAFAEDTAFITKEPTVHICGNGNWIFDKDENVLWDGGVDVLPTLSPEISGIVKKLALALTTGKWDEYCDALVNAIAPRVFSR